MTKQNKIDYINKVNDKFVNSRNHGHNGNNWWYPKQNRIAYNVKMREYFDIKELRPLLSDRQNQYYSDDTLYEIAQEQLNDNANMLVDDIEIEYHCSSGFAGRSGGWIEVDYENNLTSDEEDIKMNLENYYKDAKDLEQLESDVNEFIKERHKALNVYMSTKEYYKDMLDILTDDETIGDIYKGKAKDLLDKLK